MTVIPTAEVAAAVAGFEARAIGLRRRLHAHPEVGWTEFFATWTLREALAAAGVTDVVAGADVYRTPERLGLPAADVVARAESDARAAGVPEEALATMADGRTGLVATLDSGRPGPSIVVRADIDALAVGEADDAAHRPAAGGYASNRPGYSHACGHDAHSATVYLVAAALRVLGLPRSGRVTFLFQPAEEGARGADAFVRSGWLDGCDHFLSLHNASRDWFRTGDVAVGVHDMLATVKLDVALRGREAHAGLAPELGRSALTAASAIALLVPALPRRRDAQTITAVGELRAGSSRNIVPGAATIGMELRSTVQEEVDDLQERVERLVRGLGDALEVGTEVTVVGRADAASSSPELMALVEASLADVPGIRALPSMEYGASDDAASMMRHVQRAGGQATYLHIGNTFPGLTHTPRFDVDEEIIGIGATVLVASIARILTTSGHRDVDTERRPAANEESSR